MEPLIRNHSFLDKNWLLEISSELAALPKEIKYKDEKDKEISVNSNQISIIIFDWLCKYFFAHKEDQAIDAKLLSELWRGDAKRSWRLQDKLYFVFGSMYCFQEEALNIAKDKEDHRWFIEKVQFPQESFKAEFISNFESLPFISPEKFDIQYIRKLIRKETFEDKYPDYLHKPIADFFFE